MSYCRFGWDNSDVYVFGTDRALECCGCILGGHRSFECTSRQAMIDHLLTHRAEGDTVPDYAIERLQQEITEEGDDYSPNGGAPK